MATSDPIGDILLRWDELREQGREATPEELCGDHPELVEEVRQRIAALEAMYRIPNAPRGTETLQVAVPPPLPSPTLPQVPDCEVLSLLGSGGMGKVYKARQLSLKRLVAVKMILAGVEPAGEETGRFRVEAEAVARLQHPNIVRIFEIGEAQGCPYLVLEYVDGGSLADRLDSGPLPPDQAAALVATLARAIHFAHQQHVIHRDLKPSNVLLAGDGSPRIGDFGLAKLLAGDGSLSQSGNRSPGPALTVSGSVLGTPSYMAPEQADGRNRQIGPRTDVYGLGAILYECLTGQPPFAGANLLETLERVRSEAPVAPRRHYPELPVDLQTICLKCLAKEPEQRYASAAALAEDLERYLEREPIRARSPNLIDRLAWTLNRSRELPVSLKSLDSLQLLIPVPFLFQLAILVLAFRSPWYGWIALVVTLASMASAILIYLLVSGEGFRVPLNATTRHLWSIRVGLLLGMVTLAILSYQMRPPDRPWDPLTVFPWGAVLVGATFFSLGGVYWGRMYLFGMAFFVLALLLPSGLKWGPLALGALVSLFLLVALRHARQTRQASKS